MRLFRHAHLLSLILLPLYMHGQKPQLPITEWKSKLSIKNDIDYLKQTEVANELKELDSLHRCDALYRLQKEAVHGNTRFQIRMALIWVRLNNSPQVCTDSISNHEKMEIALRKCYESGDNMLAIVVHQVLSNEYFSKNELGLSIVHAVIAKELMEKEGLSFFRNYSWTLYTTADILYRSRDYRTAAKLNEQALTYHGSVEFNKMDSLDNYWKMNTWNNLGLCYERLMIYDSAMLAFNQAASLTKDPFWIGLLKGNRGDVFFLQEKYDSAEPLLRIDYTQSLVSGEVANASITLQRLARITSKRGDPKTALPMIHVADSLERLDPSLDNRAAIWYSYALIYKDLGMADSTFAYMEKHKAINEVITKHSAENKIEIAQLRLTNEENINEIESLQRDKSRIKLIRNFSIALILTLAAFGYMYINRMLLQSRLKDHEAMELKRKADIELALAKEQLNFFTESLREKTKLIEDLQSQSLEKEHHREQIEQMQELSTYTILTDKDWEKFKNLFTKVYPGFFIELKQHVPDITLAEQRMAALIKLDIPNKDAAFMLGISHNSIYKTRQRLRQRLGIEKDDEMDTFFREGMNS